MPAAIITAKTAFIAVINASIGLVSIFVYAIAHSE